MKKWMLRMLAGACLLPGCGARSESAQAQVAQAEPVQVVRVGKGSYASAPPPEVEAIAHQTLTREIYALDTQRPLPTNHWWTNLLTDRYAGQLWAFPHQVKADAQGIQITFPTRWNEAGTDPVSEFPLAVGGVDFKPADSRAKSWSDWLVSFRMAQSTSKYLDVTLGRGLPYVWLEYNGVTPQITVDAEAKFFDMAGQDIALPSSSGGFGLEYHGRSYGLFVPQNTRFERAGDQIRLGFSGAKSFVVVCLLPSPKDLATFARYAFAIPRDSRLTWEYDPQKAAVKTHWHLETQVLEGTEKRLIQGWLPHHYRHTQSDFQMGGPQYLTPRGTMKCAVGTDFTITDPFAGFPPILPAPHKLGLPNDFDEARMRDYLARYATRTEYGKDTYWGGKSVLQEAQYMAIARQMKDPPFEKLRDSLRGALENWFTYTPGEKESFFARYPRWGSLVGFNTSYGSEAFNDHHFHYGYFTTAAAMLGMVDPQFLRDYGGMARLVAKDYANWEHEDKAFPFMRTFDVWEGHSWAGGFSSPTGNNQESSSEAMQSWGGLFLLGTMLGDTKMASAGAMGYAMESQATMEYWFNAGGGNFAPNFAHPITGMVWSGGNLYGTYFSGDPAWIWGIQWLPMSPMLSYLVQDPAFAKKSFDEMWQARKAKEGNADVAGLGTGLGNVILGQAGQVNPDWAAQQMNQLWAAKSPVATDNDTPGLTYYSIHANRGLGQIDWQYHLSLPLSRVYFDARTKKRTFIVFNPTAQAQEARVFKGDTPVGTLHVPPFEMVATDHLQPLLGAVKTSTVPAPAP